MVPVTLVYASLTRQLKVANHLLLQILVTVGLSPLLFVSTSFAIDLWVISQKAKSTGVCQCLWCRLVAVGSRFHLLQFNP